VVNGESQITATYRCRAIERLCAEVAISLSLRGHVMFQLLVDQQKEVHFIECNCRFGGASTLSVAAGLDSFYWFILETIGVDLDEIPVVLESSQLRQIRYATDKVYAA